MKAKHTWAAIALAATLSAQAETLEDRAKGAAWADAGTTLGALALGAVEANPLGLAALALKAPLMAMTNRLPEEERAFVHAFHSSAWRAAAANNVCVIAAILTGGVFGPVCLIVGGVWGVREFQSSQMERDFWDMCAYHRRESRTPLRCTYTAVRDSKPSAEEREFQQICAAYRRELGPQIKCVYTAPRKLT